MKYSTILGAFALSACGLIDDDKMVSDPVVVQTAGLASAVVGEVPADVTMTYDEVADTITVAGSAGTVVLNPTGVINGFQFYQGYSGAWTNGVRRETNSGGGVVTLVTSPDFTSIVPNTIFDMINGSVERTSDTTLPSADTADYAGDYVAIYTVSGRDYSPMYGDANFAANFGEGTMSGSITNRGFEYIGGIDIDDITLEAAQIEDGVFSGVASGGAINTTFSSAQAGTVTGGEYTGMVVGPNGEELVGAVKLDHLTTGNAEYTEIGGFVADLIED